MSRNVNNGPDISLSIVFAFEFYALMAIVFMIGFDIQDTYMAKEEAKKWVNVTCVLVDKQYSADSTSLTVTLATFSSSSASWTRTIRDKSDVFPDYAALKKLNLVKFEVSENLLFSTTNDFAGYLRPKVITRPE